MKRTLVVVAAVLGFATAGTAANLSVVSDKATYDPAVDSTITLTVTGDSLGATAYSIIGRLQYDGALTDTPSGSDMSVGAGAHPQTGWTNGASYPFAEGQTTMFNQIAFPAATCCSSNVIATLTLNIANPGSTPGGVVNVDWYDLSFFDLAASPSALRPGTSFTILPAAVVPEPATAALVGLGLLGLAVGGRRRA